MEITENNVTHDDLIVMLAALNASPQVIDHVIETLDTIDLPIAVKDEDAGIFYTAVPFGGIQSADELNQAESLTDETHPVCLILEGGPSATDPNLLAVTIVGVIFMPHVLAVGPGDEVIQSNGVLNPSPERQEQQRKAELLAELLKGVRP